MSDVTTEQTKTQKMVPLKITRCYDIVTQEQVWVTSETYTKFLEEQRDGGGDIHDTIIEKITDDVKEEDFVFAYGEEPIDTKIEENIFHRLVDNKYSDTDVVMDEDGKLCYLYQWKRNEDEDWELDERFVQMLTTRYRNKQ